MVVVLLALLGGALAALATGGSLARLADVQLRRWWLLLTAVAAQALGALALVPQPLALAVAALGAGGFVVGNRVRGFGLVATGLASNFLAVAANSGTMPVSLQALARTETGNGGLLHDPLHSPADSHTALRLLTDVIAVPFPFVRGGEVLSAGDVLVAAGVGLVVFSAMRRPPASVGD